MSNLEQKNCNCGRPKSYKDCCGVIHSQKIKANTAEDLMRSRYTAFTLGDGDYLMRSQHSKTRNLKEKKEITKWAKSVNWIRLEVLKTSKGLSSDMLGTVEFKAFFFESGSVQMIHENSSFEKEGGYWVYVGAV